MRSVCSELALQRPTSFQRLLSVLSILASHEVGSSERSLSHKVNWALRTGRGNGASMSAARRGALRASRSQVVLAVADGALHNLAVASTLFRTLPTGHSFALSFEGQLISKKGSCLAPAEASAFAFAFR